MALTLTEWQEYLEQHFAELATSRARTSFPLFALEHGLDTGDIRAIKELLRSRIATDAFLASHWLVWVVYATEFGYEYFGDEYWQSFEEYTPYWRERGKRSFLRDWFKRFQHKYNGITPTGRWAQNFPIIACPITHAILPRYLQNQFAKALYNLRFQLARLENLDPQAIGRHISENVFDATSRFRQFLQQEELTGRLVLTLLSNRPPDGHGPIFPPTLDRVVADVVEARNAKEWLNETRRLVGERIQFAHSIGRPTGDNLPQASKRNRPIPELKPRLLLRPNRESTWSIVLETPSFAPLVGALPDLRRFLLTARCRIAGAWCPAQALLNGTRKQVVLKSWPQPNVPLLKFDKPNPELEGVITEFRLSNGPTRLFRLGSDNLALEIMGRTVRPNGRYFILFEGGSPPDNALLASAEVECHGVTLATLTVPVQASNPQAEYIRALGLQLARTVRIWPAGLPAISWDGEGVAEWLSTDRPCFGLAHDYAGVQAYLVSLDHDAPVRIDALGPGTPAFIQLPQLPVGRHQLLVRAITRASNTVLPTGESVVTLSVREPEPWIPGTTHHSGLFISLDPPVPSLDDVVDGNLSATILGPLGHSVTVSIALSDKDGNATIPVLDHKFILPVTASVWGKALSRTVQAHESDWGALESTTGQLIVKGNELGVFRLNLDRELGPVRWIFREQHESLQLRLLEDTGTDDTPNTRFYGFDRPTEPMPLALDRADTYCVPAPGGLFEGRKGAFCSLLIASPPQLARSLQALNVEPDLRSFQVTPETLIPALELLQLWLEARLVGPLVVVRRARVVNAMLARIYSSFAGQRWAEAEATCRAQPAPHQVDAFAHAVGGGSGFSIVLRRDYKRFGEDREAGMEWFADTANRYGISRDRGLCEFALQFVSQPHRMTALPIRFVLPSLLPDLAAHAILLRGARFLAILSAMDDPAAPGVLLPRWRW